MPENNASDIAGLILKTLREEAIPEESVELQEWLNADIDNRRLFEQLNDDSYLEQAYLDYKSADVEGARQKFWARIDAQENTPTLAVAEESAIAEEEVKPKRGKRIPYWLLGGTAASILIAGAVYWMNTQKTPTVPAPTPHLVTKDSVKVPEPGSDKAILVRADGSRYVLQDMPNGMLPQMDGISYNKQDGRIICSTSGGQQQQMMYDSLIVPNGGKFSLVLPDGTEVWLNSASTIRYPTGFANDERRVTITGEAYFKIAKDLPRPFIVSVSGADLQALGTSFNVNAYDEASIRASLLEGKLRVTNKLATELIKPNYSALISPTAGIQVVYEKNMSKIIAWKNGEFEFYNDPITTVAYQLGRWYNLTVSVEGHPTARVTYSDSMNRHIDTTLKSLRDGNQNIHIFRTDTAIIVRP